VGIGLLAAAFVRRRVAAALTQRRSMRSTSDIVLRRKAESSFEASR
jgi:hypothetical protein